MALVVELAAIGGALSVASAMVKCGEAIARVISNEDRRMASKLQSLMSEIHSDAQDVAEYATRAQRAKGRETRAEFLSLTLNRTADMLALVRDAIRIIARIWNRPGILERIAKWLRKMRKGKRRRG
jgi:ATP-dependent protease ClpP protease subunit